jgi:hypothetical protein
LFSLTHVYCHILLDLHYGRYSDSLRAGRFGDQIPVGERFSAPVQTSPWTHPASYTMGAGSFPEVKRLGRGVPIVQGGWVGPRAGVDWCRISRPLTEIRYPYRPARRELPYPPSYPDPPTNNGMISKRMNWVRCERKLTVTHFDILAVVLRVRGSARIEGGL